MRKLRQFRLGQFVSKVGFTFDDILQTFSTLRLDEHLFINAKHKFWNEKTLGIVIMKSPNEES